MGWTAAIVMLVLIAPAAGWFWASVVAQRRRLPARWPFLAGVLCGVTIGVALTARRRGLKALGASTLTAVLSPLRSKPGISLAGVAAGALTVAGALARLGPVPLRVFRQIRG